MAVQDALHQEHVIPFGFGSLNEGILLACIGGINVHELFFLVGLRGAYLFFVFVQSEILSIHIFQ